MRAKGLTFIGLTSFVNKGFGEEKLFNILDGLVDDPSLFVSSLDPFRWYPFDLLSQVFEVVTGELGEGDPAFAREIGACIGRFHQRLLPGDFIRTPEANLTVTMNRFWLIYHDQGIVSVIEDGEDFVLRTICPARLTRSYMEGMAGWIENLMIIWKVTDYVIVSSDEPMELRMVKTRSHNTLNNSK